MLAYFLATVMAIISLILYLNAFISPKIHRQDDFLWSGLGLFYALTLWVCAGRITGAVLLGQLAIITVAIAFMWENRQLRKNITADSESSGVLEGVSLLSLITVSLGKLSQLTQKKPSVSNKAKTDKPVKDKAKTDVVEKEKVTDSEKSVSAQIKTESSNIVEEIITDIDASQKVENIIEEIVEDAVTDDSLQEDNIIEEIVNEETKKEENMTQSSNLPLDKPKIEKNSLDDDFDIDSLGLGESPSENKPLSPPKTNIFNKLLGIFRKPSPQKTPQSEELISSTQPIENTSLEENTLEIDPKTTATEVEDAIANFDLSESNNNISEDNQKIDEASPENTTESTDEIIETSVEIVTSETEIIADTALESDNQDQEVSLLTDLESESQEEEFSLLTDLESDNPEEEVSLLTALESDNPEEGISLLTALESDNPEEGISLLTDLQSENQDEEIQLLTENTDTDLSDDINPQDIPQGDIIETLDDLSIETENVTLDLESPSEEDNQNAMDKLDNLFEEEVKNEQNQ
jgi:hypothetical protein